MSSQPKQGTPPPYTPSEARARETFLSLMWALSYPGRIYQIPETDYGHPFDLIGEALLDLETSYFLANGATVHLGQNGARALPPELAAYHFYPSLMEANLPTLREASVGTLLYPDRAATVFVGCALNADDGDTFTLTGPGVKGETHLRVGGLPREFWAIREQRCRFPLGWDIYLIDQLRVVGLPRSTKVQPVTHDAR